VWKCISICKYMCLCVINTYVCIYIYMYTYLVYLCHKQVHICTRVNVIIYSTHTKTKSTTHIQQQTCFIQNYFWAYDMMWKNAKISRKVAIRCASTSQIHAFGGPSWALRFASVLVDLRLRLWNRSEGQPLISDRLVYRGLPLQYRFHNLSLQVI